ncbi:MAG: hypothetical protein ABI893_06230 [Polaromonas sp.]|uniref:hypothetical protein n=1 Tax=Polaromonas sp. TaxID=1869339 RepID=UPI003262FA26
MKQQISRLSPHQNGKVFGVLMAIGSLVFLVPFFLVFATMAPAGAGNAPPLLMFLFMPVLYLILGYLSVAIGCALYNFMFKYLGGVEFESSEENKA